MSLSFAVLASLVGQPAEQPAEPQPTEPTIQRPASLEAAQSDAATPTEPAEPTEAVPEPAPAEPAEAVPEPAEPTEAVPEPAPAEPTEAVPAAEPAATTPVSDGERFTVSAGAGGPPFYDDADQAALRERHALHVEPTPEREGPRWRCLIADPACGRSFEVNALAAYTYRGRQGSVTGQGEDPRWHSGRAQYDMWMNFPVMSEVAGTKKFTRMTLGPKGGLIFSDGGSTWGNVGMAFRYWLGRGRWAPSIEFSSALAFKVGERNTKRAFEEEPKWEMSRGPVGFTADVGFGLGGFGAIVIGGQYDSPLAREDLSDDFRTSAAGAFFIGFRGNILWGGPAAAAVATHAATQRSVNTP